MRNVCYVAISRKILSILTTVGILTTRVKIAKLSKKVKENRKYLILYKIAFSGTIHTVGMLCSLP